MADETKRKRSGTLIETKSGWAARIPVIVGYVDGKPVREKKWFPLGTDSKALAQAKLDRILAELAAGGVPSAEQTAAGETVAQAIERLILMQRDDGLKTWIERRSRLRQYAATQIGNLDVRKVRPEHIRQVLDHAHSSGLGKQSVTHIRIDLSTIFGQLWRDEVIPENPVRRVKLSKKLRQDKRPRIVLNEDEFAKLMACSDVPEHVALMAFASRSFGGMRTSDLHAWDWSHVDTAEWSSAFVYRPKTDGDDDSEATLERLVLPEMLRAPLRAWWTRWQRPTEGPVFPIMTGKRAGERQGKRSHARELRIALWRAGVHRPLPGLPEALAALRAAEAAVEPARSKGRRAWWEAQRVRSKAELAAKALDAVQANTTRTRAVDFHSFRRAYNTALAAAGVNAQQAMKLAGHKDMRTHMRYVELTQRGALPIPEAALPRVDRDWTQLVSDAVVADALTIGDPRGVRTPVTGVRVDPRENQPLSVVSNSRGLDGRLQHQSATEDPRSGGQCPMSVSDRNVDRLPVPDRAALLALARRLREALPAGPSEARTLAVELERRLESFDDNGAQRRSGGAA